MAKAAEDEAWNRLRGCHSFPMAENPIARGSRRGLLHHVIITVSDVSRASPFYGAMFRYLGYELADSEHGGAYECED